MSRYESLRENERKVLQRTRKFLVEAPRVKKEPPTENEQLVLDSWKNLKNKTKVFETIPLIYALYQKPDEYVTAQDMIDVLNISHDWDESGKIWILTLLNKIKKDEKAYQTFISTVVEAIVSRGGPSLKDLNGGKVINDFIHGSITKFYSELKKNSQYNKDSKTFTADVVVLWGPGSASTVLSGRQLKEMEPTSESLVLLADKKTLMGCVSLKALDGRVGKVTTLFQAKFGKSFGEGKVDEGIFDGVSDMFSTAIEKAKNSKIFSKIKEVFTKFTTWAKTTVDIIKSVFSPNSKEVLEAKSKNEEIVDDAEMLLKEFDKELQEHYSKLGKPITEASEDEAIQISSCFRKQLLTWYSSFENDTKNFNKMFLEFNSKASKFATTNYFRLSFTSLPEKTKEYSLELNRINHMIKKVKTAKEEELQKKRRTSCLLLNSGSTPLTFTRKELKTILMSNANYVSLSLINNMVDQYLSKSKSLKTADSLESLIKFATELNAEAIFGAAVDIPLIKYDGKQIIKFGSRGDYEKEHSKKMADYFASVKTLPVIGLKIYPPRGSTAYYSIIMYSLADYTGSESIKPTDADFKYNVISFKCNSGSDFTFAVESDNTNTGDKILKALSSETHMDISV